MWRHTLYEERCGFMNLTCINFSAQGHYSGCEYEDNIMIKTKTYEMLREQIDSIEQRWGWASLATSRGVF